MQQNQNRIIWQFFLAWWSVVTQTLFFFKGLALIGFVVVNTLPIRFSILSSSILPGNLPRIASYRWIVWTYFSERSQISLWQWPGETCHTPLFHHKLTFFHQRRRQDFLHSFSNKFLPIPTTSTFHFFLLKINNYLLFGAIYLIIFHTKSSMASADCPSIVSKSSNCSKFAIGKLGRDVVICTAV